MNIEIRKLSPELAADYVHFFDTTSHATGKEEHKCYCVWWCSDDSEDKDLSTVEKRRNLALEYIKSNNIQGYLAYDNDRVVGWCNANTKSECLKCYCWKRFMGNILLEDIEKKKKVKSIFCFAIAPEMRGKGIAGLLLERVCKDAKEDGFDYVEGYPNKTFVNTAEDYMGPIELFYKYRFEEAYEADDKVVMRRRLK